MQGLIRMLKAMHDMAINVMRFYVLTSDQAMSVTRYTSAEVGKHSIHQSLWIEVMNNLVAGISVVQTHQLLSCKATCLERMLAV